MHDIQDMIIKRITALRLQKGENEGTYISEKELSRAIGKSSSYFSAINQNKSVPPVKVIIDICKYFEISLHDFFQEDDPNPMLTNLIHQKFSKCTEKDQKLIVDIIQSLSEKNKDVD